MTTTLKTVPTLADLGKHPELVRDLPAALSVGARSVVTLRQLRRERPGRREGVRRTVQSKKEENITWEEFSR